MSRRTDDIEIITGLLVEMDPAAPLPELGLRWHTVIEYDGDSVRIVALAEEEDIPPAAQLVRGVLAGDTYEGPISVHLGRRRVVGQAVVLRVTGAIVTVAVVPGEPEPNHAEVIAAVRACTHRGQAA